MTQTNAIRSRLRGWAMLVMAAVVLDLAIFASYFHLVPEETGRTFSSSFPLSVNNWLMWTAFAPFVLLGARSLSDRRGSWGRRMGLALALVVTLALAHLGVEMLLKGMEQHGHARTLFVSYHLWHGFLTAGVLLMVAVLMESERSARTRELREVQLQEQVSRAQLQTLRMQLQPHFLFNTLNSVSALVEDDARGGQRMIGHLSEFLRLTLAGAAHAEVPLREELALLEHYLEIERTRFEDRLRVVVEVEPGTEEARVPNLVLQPLVENAIRHGIQPSLRGGTVTVRARRDGEWLVLEVCDDGVGLRAGFDPAGARGIGISNTRQRLRECFGERQAFEIAPGSPCGTRVSLRLPWSEAAVAVGGAA